MGLICRSCREPVTPADVICPGCRANLTGPDAVLDPDAVVAEPVDEPVGDPPAEPGLTCANCAAELLPSDSSVCPGCLTPIVGAVVLKVGGWQHVLAPGASLVLGRDPQRSPAAPALEDFDTVSRVHAQVSVDRGRRATVVDLDSTNGTFVDDVRVGVGVVVPLQPGARLRLGSHACVAVESP
ncbi:FHA domain-containing protein [Asanoa siamensis]|uniref:FHA domain-containing protein n=1 Tax=Asanoa siamensis TaxID=926357 RepID=A0ABQ4CRL7_9ACTN|nr:FHA domain-containing protein [Asanoa siamensis]GIF73917.1 hypothetical protein Asi02nite_34350 [Asanoa siamensis]